jgi:hypothetical protein
MNRQILIGIDVEEEYIGQDPSPFDSKISPSGSGKSGFLFVGGILLTATRHPSSRFELIGSESVPDAEPSRRLQQRWLAVVRECWSC